jgi:xanthine dehydrogenase YagR molybdenum-binding subunit
MAPPGSPFRPLYDDQIHFSGQPVALVVAEEFEIARFAASLVCAEYEPQAHVTDFDAQYERAIGSTQTHLPIRGNPAEAFDQAVVRVQAEYRMPVEHHNPMETFAMTAVWEDDGRITVFDKTQGPQRFEDFQRDFVNWSSLLYRCASSELGQGIVKLDQNTPCDMRAPGGAEGVYAIDGRARLRGKCRSARAAADQLFR